METQKKNVIIYYQETDSWMVFFDGDERQLKDYLVEYGFVDADILHEDWLAYYHSIYKLEEQWRSNLKQFGYCILEFVGYPYHVIPKSEQTSEQYYFIKRLFDD